MKHRKGRALRRRYGHAAVRGQAQLAIMDYMTGRPEALDLCGRRVDAEFEMFHSPHRLCYPTRGACVRFDMKASAARWLAARGYDARGRQVRG